MQDYIIYFERSIKKSYLKRPGRIKDILNKKIIRSKDIYREIEEKGKYNNYYNHIIYFDKLEIATVKLTKKQIKKIKLYLTRKNRHTNFKIQKLNTKETKLEHKFVSLDFEVNWGLRYLNLENEPFKGNNVNVAVIDSGIDLTHPDFFGQIPKKNRFNSINKTNDVQDHNGHGTHVSGILFGKSKLNNNQQYGVVPKCNKFIVKALSDGCNLIELDLIYAIDWALYKNCKIINLSAGFPISKRENIDPRFDKIIEKAWEYGCFIVAAVGNDSSRSEDNNYNNIYPIHKPSNCPKAIAVSAIDSNNKIYERANGSVYENQKVDFVAPGVSIVSSDLKIKEDDKEFQYALRSGTSMATPFISGILTIYCQKYPEKSPQQIYDMILNNQDSTKLFNVDYGFGIPNIY